MRKPYLLLSLAVTPLLLSGCLGDVMEIFCEGSPDSDHCYQTAAVQEVNPENCAKIDYPPPRDKCHLLMAENTGDPTTCNGIEGNMMGYSEDQCLAAAFKNHTQEDCANAKDEMACRAAWAKNGKGCGDGYDYTDGACVKKEEKKADENTYVKGGTDDPLEREKVKEELSTMGDAAKSGYIKLLERDIANETDPKRLEGLEKYKEFLEQSQEKFEDVKTKFETLQELKKIFIDSYDPKDAIENMSVSPILGKGIVDSIKDKLFGEKPATARSDAEDSLSVYDAMLKQQKDNDFLQQSRLSRVGDTIISNLKDKGVEQLKEGAEDLAKGVAGKAFAVVGIVDHAITSFKDGAEKEAFIGLAAAYNRQRDAMAAAHPELSPEDIHKRTVAQIKDDPYQDNPNSGFVKYGNILANGDCKDAGNALCIDNRVFWTAMGKTYDYSHKKK